MFRTLLKSRIHRVAVTHGELHYEGSCAIDDIIAALAQVHEEQVPTHRPKLVFVDEANRRLAARNFIPVQQS